MLDNCTNTNMNINDYVANRVIEYLKQTDQQLQKHKQEIDTFQEVLSDHGIESNPCALCDHYPYTSDSIECVKCQQLTCGTGDCLVWCDVCDEYYCRKCTDRLYCGRLVMCNKCYISHIHVCNTCSIIN